MSSLRLLWRMGKASDRTKGLFDHVMVAALWWMASSSTIAVAAPADVLMPHLDRIRQNLPPNVVMRLPSQILLSYPADEEFIETLAVRITTSDSPPRITVGLFSCADDSPFCRIGTFSAVNTAIAQAQQDY